MGLRDYQKRAVNDALTFLEKKTGKGVVVSPTGSGKSWEIATVAKERVGDVLVIQPSKELLEQNYEKFTNLGEEATIFSASLKQKNVSHTTFATPMSVVTKPSLFKSVRTVVIDECHVNNGSSGVFNNFLKTLHKDTRIIGFTATPVVLNTTMMEGSVLKMLNRARKSLFNNICHVTQIKEMVDGGWWTTMKYEQLRLKVDTPLLFNTSGAEYSDFSQRRIYEENNLEQVITDCVNSIKHKRPSILVFVPSIDDGHSLVDRLGNGAKMVWGNMPAKERDEITKGFKNGSIQVVVNVLVYSIGFDFPGLSCVIDACATASFSRYYQKLARACRPFPNKKDALIIDLCGNYKRFGSPSSIEIKDYGGDVGWAITNGRRLLTGVSISGEPVYIK